MATDVTNGGQKNPPANPQGGQGNQTGQGNQGNPPTNPPANPPANSTGQGTGTTSTQTPPPPNPTPAQNTQTPPQQPQPMTLEEWITKNAPPGPLQEVLRNGVASFLQERTQLITTIMNSRANSFSKEWLEHQDRKIEELRNLAKMAAAADPQQAQLQTNQQQLFNLFTPGPSYAGALNLPPTGNQTPQEDKEVPTLPVWNFRTESPAKTG